MALCGCPSGVLVTAVVALLVLPAQYYVPELAEPVEETVNGSPPLAALDAVLAYLPSLDLFASPMILLLASANYLTEVIYRKIMEKRIVKLNQYLVVSVERLQSWDAQQEQLETTMKLVQNATSEYNLLLYLLLRQHRCLAADCPPSDCFFDKTLDEGLSFLNSTVEM